jgi:hypothetical protein
VGVQVASLLHGVLVLGSYQVSVSKIQLGSKTESFPSCRCFGEDKISIDWTLTALCPQREHGEGLYHH